MPLYVYGRLFTKTLIPKSKNICSKSISKGYVFHLGSVQSQVSVRLKTYYINADGDKDETPLQRAMRLLKYSFKEVKDFLDDPVGRYNTGKIFPSHCDLVIIGGGGIGSSIAYWIKQRVLDGLRVVVIEKDPTVNNLINQNNQYQQCSTTLSVGGLRQQFSLKENIEMSVFGADFLKNIDDYLCVPSSEPIRVNFVPHGYLFLATEQGAPILENNAILQASLGAKNVLLTPEKLKKKFPWINTDGIALGCHGVENEGWFDPWTLLHAYKNKALSLGVEYVQGEVLGFEYKPVSGLAIGLEEDIEVLRSLKVKCNDGLIRTVNFASAVLTAGPNSGQMAALAGIGVNKRGREIPLPVEPRKRYVYCFHAPDGPGLNTPLTIDPHGVYFRREGICGHYICGKSPEPDEEPDCSNLDVDCNFFDEKIWPLLANRVPAFENLKVTSSWAGFYDYNCFDQNVIIGQHPYCFNLFFCTGCSGHGIQQTPALGRAMMELIIDGKFTTLDLSRFSFQRLIDINPVFERNIV